MAEPWTEDFAALAERTKTRLRSQEATRAAVLATRAKPQTRLRLFKDRPILATLTVLAAILLAAPAAYAVIDRVFLSVDPEKPAPEIARDVESQLEAAGIPATVSADKDDDGNASIKIRTADQRLGSNLEIAVPDTATDERSLHVVIEREREIRLELACALTDAQSTQLHEAVARKSFVELLTKRPAGQTDPELVRALVSELANRGFHDVAIRVSRNGIVVRVTAPPRP